jgi:hypothetical protein
MFVGYISVVLAFFVYPYLGVNLPLMSPPLTIMIIIGSCGVSFHNVKFEARFRA